MSALNAILLVGMIFAATRAQGSSKCKNYRENNLLLKKTNERAYLIISKNVCIVSLRSRSCFDPVLNNRRSFDNIHVVIAKMKTYNKRHFHRQNQLIVVYFSSTESLIHENS